MLTWPERAGVALATAFVVVAWGAIVVDYERWPLTSVPMFAAAVDVETELAHYEILDEGGRRVRVKAARLPTWATWRGMHAYGSPARVLAVVGERTKARRLEMWLVHPGGRRLVERWSR